MTDAAALVCIYKSMKTMADGTVRASFDFEGCSLENVARVLGQPGDTLAIARLTEEAAAQTVVRPQSNEKPYGPQAKILRQSGFFRAPRVWALVGTDDNFAEWIQKKKCCICGDGDWVEELGEQRCEAAHVRRAGENGTAYKADYARVPMCHMHHIIVQHHQGEHAAYAGYLARKGEAARQITPQEAKDWFDKKRVEYVELWAWETLKKKLGFDSWGLVPPETLYAWAKTNDVERLLPNEYRTNNDERTVDHQPV